MEHFYKDGGPSWTVTMQFPEENEGRGWELFLKMAVPIKETDLDWELGNNGEQQYFYKRIRGKESWTI